jgi:hypothetical protein
MLGKQEVAFENLEKGKEYIVINTQSNAVGCFGLGTYNGNYKNMTKPKAKFINYSYISIEKVNDYEYLLVRYYGVELLQNGEKKLKYNKNKWTEGFFNNKNLSFYLNE